MRVYNLLNGRSHSCGCMNKTHQDSRRGEHHRLYRIWSGMKCRCNTPTATSYSRYGAIGISVCSEWQNYETFKSWALKNGYNDNLTLDRINIDGNYCPDNCRWVSMKTQGNNREDNVVLEYNGEKHTMKEWSELLDINYATLQYRVYAHWPIEKIFTTEVKRYAKRIDA